MGKDRHREITAIAVALLAHILFLRLQPRETPPPPPPPVSTLEADTTIDLEPPAPAPEKTPEPATEPAPTPAPAPARATAPAPDSAPAPAPASDSAPASGSAPAPAPASAPATAPAPDSAPAPGSLPSLDGFDAPAVPGPITGIPGLPGGGAPIWSIPGVLSGPTAGKPAATTIEAPRAVDADVASKVLSGTLHTKDKATGIDVPAAGVVATSIATAVRGTAVKDARATFEVKLSGDGKVEGVRLVSSTDGDANHWAGVAENVRASLDKKTLQMGADKKGVTIRIKVESKVQYPAGTKERVDVQPVCANEVIEQIAAMAQEAMKPGGGVRGIRDDQGTFIPYGELDEERRRRFCIPIGIRGKGDVSNIGALMTNVVSSSFEIIRQGEKALPSGAPLAVDRRAPWLPADDKLAKPPPRPKKKKKKKTP